jgi:hypothetical protein
MPAIPPLPKPSTAPPRRRGFWAKIFASKFLFVSILIHLFFVAGAAYYVVQRFSPRPKLTFKEGPPSSNPSKHAIEHKVSMAKQRKTMSAPAQAKRIMTAGLATVALPEMPSMPTATEIIPGKMAGMGGNGIGMGPPGGGMGNGGGGGGAMPLFGFRERGGGGSLTGYLYDLKQNREGKPTGMDVNKYAAELTKFCQGGWNEGMLAQYFKSPKPLFLTQVFIPDMIADEAPKAFDVDKGPHKVEPKMWAAIYKGKVIAPFSGKFRFIGFADDVLEVRFEGRHVLSAGCHMLGGPAPDKKYVYDFLEPARQSWYATMGDRVSAPIAVQQGQTYDIEVMIGEEPGGYFCAHLLWEQEGANYEKDHKSGNPRLPIFQLAAGHPAKTHTLPPFQTGENVVMWKSPGAGSGSLLDALKPPSM